MSRRTVPEPWASWLVGAGFVDPRARQPLPSARQLADRLGVSTTTVMNMMHGESDTEHATVAAVAEALRVDVRTVAREVGQARSEQRPYTPPFEANLLSRRQQRAVSELIRAIAEERGSHGRNAATTTQAGGSPAARVRSGRASSRTSPEPGSTPTPTGETPQRAQP